VYLFTLNADVCGVKHQVSADHTPAGIFLNSPTGRKRARTLSDAIRIAAREVGVFCGEPSALVSPGAFTSARARSPRSMGCGHR
jgi:hypothetical protein